MPDPRPPRVCVAAIAGAYGVRGEARVKSFTADPLAFVDYAPLETEDGARQFTVKVTRPVAGGFAARLSGVATREDAEALKGTRLYVPRDRLPPLEEDEFYHVDLIGLAAFDTGGVALGRVLAVDDFGAGDVIDIGGPGLRTLTLPFTRANAPTVDIAGGRIVIDPPAEVIAPDFGKGDGEDG